MSDPPLFFLLFCRAARVSQVDICVYELLGFIFEVVLFKHGKVIRIYCTVFGEAVESSFFLPG